MVGPIPREPEMVWAAVGTTDTPTPESETAQGCVDCAVNGRPPALTTAYTVSGTVLCAEHAVLARTAQQGSAQ